MTTFNMNEWAVYIKIINNCPHHFLGTKVDYSLQNKIINIEINHIDYEDNKEFFFELIYDQIEEILNIQYKI